MASEGEDEVMAGGGDGGDHAAPPAPEAAAAGTATAVDRPTAVQVGVLGRLGSGLPVAEAAAAAAAGWCSVCGGGGWRVWV